MENEIKENAPGLDQKILTAIVVSLKERKMSEDKATALAEKNLAAGKAVYLKAVNEDKEPLANLGRAAKALKEWSKTL